MHLPADPQADSCFQARPCVAPLVVSRRNSTAARRSTSAGYELVAAEAARSVWYWAAPADWFQGQGSSDIRGLVLQLQLGTHAAVEDSHISEGAPEEETSELAARARDRRQDVVFFHSDGQAVALSLDVTPVGPAAHSFTYWIRCEFEEGKWFGHSSSRDEESAGPGRRELRGNGFQEPPLEASREMVEHVLGDVAWLMIRGVYQAVQVGSNFVDPETVGSQGNALGVVHITQTAIRGASLVQVGNVALDLVRVWPMSGPVTGHTLINVEGTHLKALDDMSDPLFEMQHTPVCLWKCSSTEPEETSILTILNDTHAWYSTSLSPSVYLARDAMSTRPVLDAKADRNLQGRW